MFQNVDVCVTETMIIIYISIAVLATTALAKGTQFNSMLYSAFNTQILIEWPIIKKLFIIVKDLYLRITYSTYSAGSNYTGWA